MTALFVILISGSRAGAQESSDEKKLTVEAGAAYDSKDWAKSVALYEKLTQAHPEIPRFWFRLGTSLQELGQLDRSTDGGKTWKIEYDFTYIRKK